MYSLDDASAITSIFGQTDSPRAAPRAARSPGLTDAPPVTEAPNLTKLLRQLSEYSPTAEVEAPSEPEPPEYGPGVTVAPGVVMYEQQKGGGALLGRDEFLVESAPSSALHAPPRSVLLEPADPAVVRGMVERAHAELTERLVASKGDFASFLELQRNLGGSDDVSPELESTYASLWGSSMLHVVPKLTDTFKIWEERPPNARRTPEEAWSELPLSIRTWIGPFLFPQKEKQLDGGDSSSWRRPAASSWMLPGAAKREIADPTGGVRRRRERFLRGRLIVVLHLIELLVGLVHPSSKGAGTEESPRALGMRAHSGRKIDPQLVRSLERQRAITRKPQATNDLKKSADPISADPFASELPLPHTQPPVRPHTAPPSTHTGQC